MKKSRKTKEFNIGELSGEAVKEWYAERQIEDLEKEDLNQKEEKDIFSNLNYARDLEKDNKELLRKEKDKKLLIKDEIKKLLDIGEKKGLEYAIMKAKKSNNSFLLDVFHDILAKNENYKKLLKK